MKLARSLSVASFVSVLSLFSVACGDAGEDASDPKVTLAGKVGSGTVATRSFLGVTGTGAGLHVVAHQVHKRGERARNVDVIVGSDGRFSVDVTRGARWIVTVDDADGGSAIVSFGGRTVIAARADGGSARVDIGSLHLVGGEARADVVLDGAFGLAATLAEADEIIESANGAVIAAHDAAEEARAAAQDAIDTAGDAAEAAKQAAEAARAAGGITP